MRSIPIFCLFLAMLFACQSTESSKEDSENSTVKPVAAMEKGPKTRSLPTLPVSDRYRGFIIYFKTDVNPSDVLFAINEKLGLHAKVTSKLSTDGVLVDLIFSDEDKNQQQEKRNAFWEAMHHHAKVEHIEPNLIMQISQ